MRLLPFAIVVLTTFVLSTANADTIPAASASMDIYDGIHEVSASTSGTITMTTAGFDGPVTATAEVRPGLDPYLSAQATGAGGSAGAEYTFYYSIIPASAATGDVEVPIDLAFSAEYAAPGSDAATASIFHTFGDGTVSTSTQIGGSELSYFVENVSDTLHFSVQAGTVQQVRLDAGVNTNDGNTTAYMRLDPMISIDSGFSSAADYSIAFSPKMLTASVPDGGNTLALLLTGICAVGAGTMRRRVRRSRNLPRRFNSIAVTLPLILMVPAAVHAGPLGLPVITEQGAVEPTVTDSLSTRYRFDSTTSGAFAGTGTGPMYSDSGPVGTGMTGQAAGDVELTPSPSVHAYASVSKTTPDTTWSLTASADSYVSYNFEILSLNASSSPTAVPIAVTASGGVTASSGAGRYSSDGDFGSAYLTIFSADGRSILSDQSSYSLELASSPTANATPPFSETGIYNFDTNTVYTIRLHASAYVDIPNAPGVITDTISAFVDPVLQIAPGTPNAQNYSLEFSDGVGNSPNTVPDTGSTALLLVAGLAALSLIADRLRIEGVAVTVSSLPFPKALCLPAAAASV